MKHFSRSLLVLAVLCVVLLCSGCGSSYELLVSDDAEGSSAAGTSAAAEAGSGTEWVDSAESTGRSSGEEAADDGESSPEARALVDTGKDPAAAEPPSVLYVYVCGAVRRTGVYTLPQGSRVYEAIAAAGGLTEEADPGALNQAELLEDGRQITVFTREEVMSGRADTLPGSRDAADGARTSADAQETAGGKVNLNTAGREELMTLSGIGAVRADAIIAYRNANGAFFSTEELMQVDGIAEKSYQKLKDRITV